MSDYRQFIAAKAPKMQRAGFDAGPMPDHLFGFQADVTEYLLSVGRGAAFLDTGLGKTVIQLEWARQVAAHSRGRVLIHAPLAVGPQTEREAHRFGIDAKYVREPSPNDPPVTITNYERLHLFDAGAYAGIVLDESSILKSFTGVTTRRLIESFAATPYRLACTATPAPNDYMELGQHSEFLGAMESSEMLARWFVADQTQMGRYRLKGHAIAPFWDWVASWARCVCHPSDLGYPDDGFALPPLNLHRHTVQADIGVATGENLFRIPDTSATSIHREKRLTKDDRAKIVADLVRSEPDEPWIVWCETDYDADAVCAAVPEAVEVRGSMPAEKKEAALVGFSTGSVRVLVTKPSIAGFGLNWQHCARVAFHGLSFSYESYYQAVRRCWRFMQQRPVEVHIIQADTERAIWDTVQRKSHDHSAMKDEMRAAMKRAAKIHRPKVAYSPRTSLRLPPWLYSSTSASGTPFTTPIA